MPEFGEIRDLLPHGAGMVLVDRVIADGRSARASKAISGGEPCYLHLPSGLPKRRYAYPRSLLLESFGQAAAVLWLSQGDDALGPGLLMFAAARDCRFHGDAYPGDVVEHRIELDSSVARTGFASGEIWVRDNRIATIGSFIAVVRVEMAASAAATATAHATSTPRAG